eukprot:239605_1
MSQKTAKDEEAKYPEQIFKHGETNILEDVKKLNDWLKSDNNNKKESLKLKIISIRLKQDEQNDNVTRCKFVIDEEERAITMHSYRYMVQDENDRPTDHPQYKQGKIIRLIYRPDDKIDIDKRNVKIFENTVLMSENEIMDKNLQVISEEIEVFLPRNAGINMSNDLCNNFLNAYGRSNWEVPRNFKRDEKTGLLVYVDIKKMYEMDLQWFYLDEYKLPIGIKTNDFKESKLFFGAPAKIEKNKLQKYLRRRKYNDLLPKHYQNITEPLWIACRYKLISEKILYGQDNQFNIFRSFCFLPPPEYHEGLLDNQIKQFGFFSETLIIKSIGKMLSDERVLRLSIGILCLILQVFLMIGIVMEVIYNWDVDFMFERTGSNLNIMIISFLAFAFILLIYYDTAQKFYQFYSNMEYVANVSWIIYILDYISNIVVGFVISWISLFFLLQSETITDVVLNSFALTFIIELDDMANLFEADENVLIENDWYHLCDAYVKTDYDSTIRARDIVIPYNIVLVSAALTIFSIPFGIILSFLYIIRISCVCCRKRNFKANRNVNERVKLTKSYDHMSYQSL